MVEVTLGAEEEFQLIDITTGELRQVNVAVLDIAEAAMGGTVHGELLRSQIEVSTPVCGSLDELDRELRSLRRHLSAAASSLGCRLGAAATHPAARWEAQEVTPKDRYLGLVDAYQQVARELLIFGCHVHVGIDDLELRIDVMNRVRVGLPVLLALSANSPFWAGGDTGFASYRTMIFRRLPQTGVPLHFKDHAEYQRLVDCLVAAGSIDDASKLYWDLRPSARFPTLEFRIADVCLTVDEAVTLAGLGAALVVTARNDALARVEPTRPRQELLEAAKWHAARHGLQHGLIDVGAGALRPAEEVVGSLLDALRPALEDLASWDRVQAGVAQILRDGTGADRQRAVFRGTGDIADVIRYIGDQTCSGI